MRINLGDGIFYEVQEGRPIGSTYAMRENNGLFSKFLGVNKEVSDVLQETGKILEK